MHGRGDRRKRAGGAWSPTLAVVVALLIWTAAWGQEAGKAAGTEGKEAGEVADKDLKKPWDFAPEERVIEGRKREEYVRKGTLLSDAEHVDVVHSDEELWERRIALYEGGEVSTGANAASEGASQDEGGGILREEAAQDAGGEQKDTSRWWTMTGLVVFILSAVVVGVALGRKRS